MLLVNIIHVNTIAMNKIKNIYRTLILLLSLVLMPMEGWASDGALVAEKANLYAAITSSNCKYACLYIEDNGTKLDFSSWTINSGTVGVDEWGNWIGFKKREHMCFIQSQIGVILLRIILLFLLSLTTELIYMEQN